ncbi:hypothetical protein Acr_08g0019200 [Actinidia rufa]|uniref:Uncharacterized protein n=1 Tax=Actinidia rufa TaxID=165716 RepID=A0A7J0F4C3_9ERIC|nr:hypothetical protein Acr_08g0019200 [Actinidia rufa]
MPTRPLSPPPPPPQPRESSPPPPPPPALARAHQVPPTRPPPAVASPPPSPPPPRRVVLAPPRRAVMAPPPPSPPRTATTSSVPTSPIIKKTSTTTPKPSPTSTTLLISSPVARSSPKPTPPKPRASVPTYPPSRPPPSPLTLPPAQWKSDVTKPHDPKFPPEAEQKTVLVQETIEKPKNNTHSPGNFSLNGKGETMKEAKTKESGHHHKKLSDSEDFGMRVITIAGENKGAIMELSPNSHRKHEFGGNPNPNQSAHKIGNPRTMSDGEKSGSESSKNQKARAVSSTPMNAIMNSNVQGVNDSILYNCSCTLHDPGVHLSLSRKSNGGGHGIQIKDPPPPKGQHT